MLKIPFVLVLLGFLLSSPASSDVQVSIGIGLPHVSIGINVGSYPQLVAVPGYPVYYAPRLQANFFFYDGMYWVYQDDDWYASSWYNGPWWVVGPEVVPVYVLRIPVRYYRSPPPYFHSWRSDAPPRWGDHWGRDWEQHRSGWDKWDRRSAPPPAPLPDYQRQYSGDRYPRQVEQQYELHQQNYHYQPREPAVKQHYEEQAERRSTAQQGKPQQERQGSPENRDNRQQDTQRSPRQQENPGGPRPESPQGRDDDTQRSAPVAPQQGRSEPKQRPGPLEERDYRQQDMQRSAPRQQENPGARSEPPPRHNEEAQPSSEHGRPEVRDQQMPSQPSTDQHEQPMPKQQGKEQRQQGRDVRSGPDSRREQDQERGGWDSRK